MSSPKDSNDSYVKRNAMSIVSADGKKVFRTAFLGYNKSAVNDYIDRLYSEYSDGEKALTSEISKLKSINSELKKKNDEYDARFEEVRAQVNSELAFVSEYHNLENEYTTQIDALRQEKDSLEEKVKAGDELNTSLRQRLESSINRADDLQRTLDGQKEVLTILRSGGNDSDSSGRILEITERIEQIRKTAQEREAQLNSQIEKLKEQSYEAVRRLADAEQQRDEAVSVAGTAANQVKQIRDEFSTRIAQLISQRDRAIARNNEKMQAHYDAMLKRYEYSAAELKRENARLSSELSSAASGNSQSEADNAEQQRFLVEAREIVASAIEERDHAIARNNERIQARIDSLIADNNRKNAELLREIE